MVPRSSYLSLPALPAAFQWTDKPWGPALVCEPLAACAPHLFTTRQLELSQDGFRALADSLGARSVATLTQVHGRSVVVHRRDEPAPRSRPDADAVISDAPELALAVRAADCVPLLLADKARGVVGAVHAGWRGTVARVAVAAVDALVGEFHSRPQDLVVAIGPRIGACCYEVGSELVDAFAAARHERSHIDRWFVAPPPPRGSHERPRLRLDLARANIDQLVLAGVPEDQIFDSGLCTAMHLEWLTSYRAEKNDARRLAGVIRARPG